MRNFFNMNNPFWNFMGKLVDVFVLHILWIVCSLPIITFGGSTTALYYTCMKLVKDEDPHYIKSFIRSFKENWKSGIVLGLLAIIVAALLGFAFWFYSNQQNPFLSFMGLVTIGAIIIYAFLFVYVFALHAKFYDSTGRILQNALFISVRHFPRTIAMIAITAAVYVIAFLLGFFPILLLGYGLVAFLNSYILVPTIKLYLPKEEEDNDENWHMDNASEESDSSLFSKAKIPVSLNDEHTTDESGSDDTPKSNHESSTPISK